MAYYKLYRSKPEGKAVRGKLYVAAGTADLLLCSTLENLDKLIPALIFPLTVTYSGKFKRLMPLVCNVPGRAGIRIHPGTKPEHSLGCILVPNRKTEYMLRDRLLAEKKAGEEIRIEVIDCK